MISFREVAVLDKNSEYRGVPPLHLMENAGRGLAEEIYERHPDKRVVFVCGTGNNGGDAYVAARYLSEKMGPEKVTVYLLKGFGSVKSEIARKNLDRLDCEVVEELDWSVLNDCVLVDALLGTGIKGRIREPYRSAIQKMNGSGCSLISVDVPSGLGADMQAEPDLTVTFHDVKEGMSEEKCGEIVVKDIDIPEKAEKFTGPGELFLYPTPRDDSHKGDNGTLMVVGGGPYTGAPALSAMAAYRAGVDLVFLAVPESIKDVEASYSPSFIVHSLKGERLGEEHVDEVKELSEKCDAVLIGPGLGQDEGTMKAVRRLVSELELPVVVDADGLKALAGGTDVLRKNTILTPHRGEFDKLYDVEELHDSADEFALKNEVVLLVKGKVDYITDGKRTKKNDFGTPSMTVGGTGDTLAGVIGALLAKGMDSFDAARVGAYITCRAGEFAFDKWNWGLMPEDISEEIPTVLKDIK